jgi:hypothetical protein
MAENSEIDSLKARIVRLEALLAALIVAPSYDFKAADYIDLEYLLRRISRSPDKTDDSLLIELVHAIRDQNTDRSTKTAQIESTLAEVQSKIDRIFQGQKSTEAQLENTTVSLQSARSELQRLYAKNQALQEELHSFLIIPSLDLPTSSARFQRLVPVRIYFKETPSADSIVEITNSVNRLAETFGFSVSDDFPAIQGSWFKKWIIRSRDAITHPELQDRLQKIERALELKGLEKPQSEIDKNQAQAIAEMIKSLEKIPEAAIQSGSVLLVKTSVKGKPNIRARTLSQREMIILEKNPDLLFKPQDIFSKIRNL